MVGYWEKRKGSTPEGVTKETDYFQSLLLVEQEIQALIAIEVELAI